MNVNWVALGKFYRPVKTPFFKHILMVIVKYCYSGSYSDTDSQAADKNVASYGSVLTGTKPIS